MSIRVKHNTALRPYGHFVRLAKPRRTTVDVVDENGTAANDADLSGLFRKIEQREKGALFDLYNRTGRLLFGLTLKILGDPADAEDALFDIYTHIWKDPASYNADSPPLAWLVMTARSHALTRLYKTDRSYAPAQTTTATDAYKNNVVDNRKHEDAVARLETLAPMQREILDWAFHSGLSAEKIAAKTGASAGAVKVHLRIGLNRLSKAFESPGTNSEPAKRQETPMDKNEGNAP